MIFVDSNVPMYLIGPPHARKADAQHLLERCVTDRQRLVTDAEVFQEILHRYVAIERPDAIQPAFDALLHVVDEVFVVDQDAVERAKRVILVGFELGSEFEKYARRGQLTTAATAEEAVRQAEEALERMRNGE